MKTFLFEQLIRLFLTLLFPVLILQTADAAIASKQSGPWSSASTWVGGIVPSTNEPVVIQAGHTVTRTGNFNQFASLFVYGTLVYPGVWSRTQVVGTELHINGLLRVEGGSLIVNAVVNGTGAFRQTGGTTTFSKGYILGYTDLQGGDVYFTNTGNAEISSNNMNLSNARLTISSPPAYHVKVSMSWRDNGVLKTGSQLEIEDGASLTFHNANSKQYNDGTILNHGTMYCYDNDIDRFTETGNIYNYGLWKFDVGGVSSSYIQHQNVVNYSGEIEKKGTGSVLFFLDGQYHDANYPSFHVQQGSASIATESVGQELNGTWKVDAGASLYLVSTDADKFIPFDVYKFVNHGAVYGGVNFLGGDATILEGDGKYERLEVSEAGTEVRLDGSPEVLTEFKLTTGRVVLYSHDLRLGKSLLSATGNYDSYVQTNGLGSLVRTCQVGYPVFFPVGNGDFAQFYVRLTPGSTEDNVKVRVKDSFFGEYNGITPACTQEIPLGVVRHTWFVSEQTPGGSIADVSAYWLTTSEANGFDQTNCTLGRYTGGNWQSTGFGTALFGGALSIIQRSNITSFGMFGVYDAGHEPDLNFVAPTPTANTPLCEWSDLQLHSNTTANVQWTGPNGFQSNNHNPSVVNIQQGQSGTYMASVSQYGCPPQQVSVNVQVYAEPNAGISGPDEIQPGEAADLTATGGTSYLWSTGETTATITVWPSETTAYYVTVSNVANCSATAGHIIEVTNVSAAREADATIGGMKVVPNPASESTQLIFESVAAGEAQLRVTDVRGAQVLQQQVVIASGQNRINISLAQVPAGTYQVSLIRENEVRATRVVKLMGE